MNDLILQLRVKFTRPTLNVEIFVDYSNHIFGTLKYFKYLCILKQHFIRRECMS